MLFLFAVRKIEIGWMAGAKNSASPAGMDRKRRLVGRSTFIKDLKILATYTRDDCVCTAVGGRSLALPSKRVPYTRLWWRRRRRIRRPQSIRTAQQTKLAARSYVERESLWLDNINSASMSAHHISVNEQRP
jgi:hypothetical protein